MVTANVLFPFSSLALLVVAWLDKRTLLICFEIKIVLFKPRDYLFVHEKGLLHVTLRATAPFAFMSNFTGKLQLLTQGV